MNKWIAIKKNQINNINLYDEVFSNFSKLNKKSCTVYYNRDGRFENDQVFIQSDEKIIVVDGVILNLSELKNNSRVSSLSDLIEKIDDNYNKLYFENFIGPFCGIYYNCKKDVLIAYGNQTGDAPVFYYSDENIYVISNELNLIVDLLKISKRRYHFDEKAALHVMTFGYMIDDRTLIQEIKRLEPGNYLEVNDSKGIIHSYYKPFRTTKEITIDEAVEKVDVAFRRAVKRCFDKDMEYGYTRHLADMSGGLDSRMVCWVAKELGYNNIVNISYSQAFSSEHQYASEVAANLGNSFLHEQLDEANFIFDVDRLIGMQYGTAIYYGITGGEIFLRSLSFEEFGLEHTGQLGDVILGTYTQNEMPIGEPYKRYSNILAVEIESNIARKYQNIEQFLLYTRGFLGVLSTHLIRRNYTYAVSPFLDIDFLDVCMSLPIELRRGNKLYWEWLDKKYPMAGQMNSTRERPKEQAAIFVRRVLHKIQKESNNLLYKMGISKSKTKPNDMNPIQYWYDEKKEIRLYIEGYYKDYQHLLEEYSLTFERVSKLMSSQNATDKLIALTVVAIIKRYFGDTQHEKDSIKD